MPPVSLDTMTIEKRARAIRAAYVRNMMTGLADRLRRLALRPVRA